MNIGGHVITQWEGASVAHVTYHDKMVKELYSDFFQGTVLLKML